VVSCPFSHVISPRSARAHLGPALGRAFESDHSALIVYLALHRLDQALPSSVSLVHRYYVDTLPDETRLRTPLWFSEQELRLLQGTNLLGATLERKAVWQSEWESVATVLLNEVPSIILPWFVLSLPRPTRD
jgi:hypothetical protein